MLEADSEGISMYAAAVASCVTKVLCWQKADNGLQWWMMTLVNLSDADAQTAVLQ